MRDRFSPNPKGLATIPIVRILLKMDLVLRNYLEQKKTWPDSGRHILAQYNSESIIVYQAYNSEIGNFAAANQFFGGSFSLGRMSWIKPNFLWMMFRSDWGTGEGQTVVLAVRIKMAGFLTILENAVLSTFVPEIYGTHENWQKNLSRHEVRLQWDPDHNPFGGKENRRAIQLGMKGSILKRYARDWILEIQDISDFVRESSQLRRDSLEYLVTPEERVFPLEDEALRKRIGLDPF